MNESDVSNQISLLKKQIDESKYDVYVDSYPMSLLELINLYKEGDIYLKAEYQRVFKWTNDQKTKFIESLFLSLPIPPIFLYQDDNAIWEVVDGIQRLSTIFQFVGLLEDETGNKVPELLLTDAPKLSNLKGLKYVDFPDDLQREFRKFKLDLVIISKKSKKEIKLEVFRRLNGFGTQLNRQELRNAFTLLLNPDYFRFTEGLSKFEQFLNCFKFSEDQLNDKKHYEYIIRYLVLREKQLLLNYPSASDTKVDDLFDYCIIDIIENNKINIYEEERLFKRIFTFLNKSLGSDSFRKYYDEEDKFKLQVRESIFDVIVPGLAKYIEYYEVNSDTFVNKVKALYRSDSHFEKILTPNPRAIDRMKKLVQLSEEYFIIHEQY